MLHDTILEEYDRALPALRARGEVLRARVEERLREDGELKIHSVSMRLKSRESLAGKLARPDRTYKTVWDVTDLVGIRVITYFEDAVDRVAAHVEAALPIDFVHSVDKRRLADAAAFGYRSLHYVSRLGDGEALSPEARCEVQIRSLLEHAWAEIEHDLGYKARDTVPAHVRRRLSRLAGLLELADNEFVAIRRDLAEYASALPTRIERRDHVPLDRLSLASLVDCPEARGIDDAIARALGVPLGEDVFYPEYLLKMLERSGVVSIDDAREGLAANEDAILAMVRPYFAFAEEAWQLSPERMTRLFRGYALFFLAHAKVLRSPALGIDKVERLAHFYRALDYPDDAQEAQRVASRLVAAFATAS